MASYSSSSANNFSQRKYDVFVSFKGEDTRESFISDLYTALLQKQIKIFTDYQQFRGNEMSQTVQKAIEASSILVVIFSKGYASSVWCLDELVKILEHKNKNGQIVIPVFYRVYPSDVKNQTGIFGESFSTLEEKREDKLQRWRNALKEAANLLADFDSHVLR
ncbi:TIR-NBS disease resistance-like protein [Melia azedarach]|nr:TIR-NBS disease resistance-like protein [Melia azedarach]